MDRKGKINAIREFVLFFFVVRIKLQKFRFSNARPNKKKLNPTSPKEKKRVANCIKLVKVIVAISHYLITNANLNQLINYLRYPDLGKLKCFSRKSLRKLIKKRK